MSVYDENEKNDYFEDASDAPEVKKKEPPKPMLRPDDPLYWEEPESEFEHLKPSGWMNWRYMAGIAGVAVALFVLWWVYSRMFVPRVDQATQYGYIDWFEREGEVFKTFEGILLPYKNLMDTTRVYEGDMRVSTANPSLAAKIKRLQYANRPVRITYSRYSWPMPWRGATVNIITEVDSVDERDILPPDRQPPYLSPEPEE